MMNFQYHKVDLNAVSDRSSDLDVLNDLGARGWKVIWISPAAVAYMIREDEVQAAQQPEAAKTVVQEPRVKRAYVRRTPPASVPADG